MKNSLYVIAGLLVVIWAILFYGFNTSGIINILLFVAIFIIVVRLLFNRQLSKKYVIFKEKIAKENIK
jgi:hypothetical protein